MGRRPILGPFVAAAMLLAAVGPGGGASTTVPAAAQSAIECAPPASPAAMPATPTASPEAASAAPITFPSEGELTIFAATSLTAAFDQIIADVAAANPGITIAEPNYAGSQALVTQLSEGAEADVFASAGGKQMSVAVENGVVAGEPVAFTQNRLAVVVPTDNPAGIDGPEDLSQDGLKLVLALPDVPVGQYAREAICTMGADAATYGEGFVDAVAGNVVSEEDNVKAVLAKVQLGEADAGVVYTTDVTAEVAGDVTLIGIPEDVNVVAEYPIAAVAGGDEALAAAFIAYVLGPEGQATLQSFGFEPRP